MERRVVVFGQMKIKCLLLTLLFFSIQLRTAQAEPTKDLCELPLKIPSPTQVPPGVVTEKTISMKGLALPSLWWDTEQFDPFEGQLVSGWRAYPEDQRIDLVVNRQLWSLMDFLQRYRYVNQLGTVARGYQYDLRILATPNRCLATYVCQLESNSAQNCQIRFDLYGLSGLETNRGVGF